MRLLPASRAVSLHIAALTVAALALFAAPRQANAQDSVACDACASCTTALAQPRARVHIEQDLTASTAGACITVAGANAQFDGRGHTVRLSGAATVGVQVSGASVLLRNVNVTGAGVGIQVAGTERTTIFNATIDTRDVGIRVNGSRSVRIARSQLRGSHVGIAFGDATGTTCPDSPMRSPGAVIARNLIEHTGTAITACDAAPVLTDNVIVRNLAGVVLGAPSRGTDSGPGADAPYDPCVCAPPYEHVHAGTTLLYSSGCGSCQVHEGWLPDLHSAHHDIVARETGREHIQSGQQFDDFMAQCVPEIWDSLGIPGCVPNYSCQANNIVSKNREGAEDLRLEAQLDSPEQVAQFADACEAAARSNYREGASCVRYALRGNVVCGNRGGDILAAAGARRFGGAHNACGSASGWADEGATGCAQPCPSTLPTSADAPAPSGQMAAGAGHDAPAPAPTAAPTPTPAPSPVVVAPPTNGNAPVAVAAAAPAHDATAPSSPAQNGGGPSKTLLIVVCLLGIAGLVGFALTRPG